MVNMEPTSLRRSWSSSCSWLLPTYEWPDPNLKTNPPKQSRYILSSLWQFPLVADFRRSDTLKKMTNVEKKLVTLKFEAPITRHRERSGRGVGGGGRLGRGLGRGAGGRESRPGPRRGTRKFLNCHLSVSSSKVVFIPASQRPSKKTIGKISRFRRFSF